MTPHGHKPRLAFNLLQLYSLEAWGDETDELPMEECVEAFIKALLSYDADGAGELNDWAIAKGFEVPS